MTLIRSLIQPLIRPLVRSLQEPVIGGGSSAITVVSPIVEIPSLDETGVILSSNASAVDDFYNGQEVTFSGGDVAVVADYVGATRTITFVTPFPTGTGPGVGETVTFVPRISVASTLSIDWAGQSQLLEHTMGTNAIYVASVNRTFFCWGGKNLDPYVAAFDHTTGKVLPFVRVGDNPLTADDHGIPAIAADTAAGRLEIFWGTHNGQDDPGGGCPWAISGASYDYTTWTAQSNFGVGDGITYPFPVYTGGTKYFFCRNLNASDTKPLSVYKYSSGWGSPTDLIQYATGDWCYPHEIARDSNGDLHIVGTEYQPGVGFPTCNPFHVIYRVADDTIDTLDGTEALSLPVSKADMDAHAVIESTNNTYKSAWNVCCGIDENDDVHVAYWKRDDTAYTVEYATHNGTSWVISTVKTYSTAKNVSRLCMKVRSSTDIDLWLDNDDDDVERWHYNGTSWTKAAIYTGLGTVVGPMKKVVDIADYQPYSGTDFELMLPQMDDNDFVNNDLKLYLLGNDTPITGVGVSTAFSVNPSTDVAVHNQSTSGKTAIDLTADASVLAVSCWVNLDSFAAISGFAQCLFDLHDGTDGIAIWFGDDTVNTGIAQVTQVSTYGGDTGDQDITAYTPGDWLHCYYLIDQSAGGAGNTSVRIVCTSDGSLTLGDVLDTTVTVANTSSTTQASIRIGNRTSAIDGTRGFGGSVADFVVLDAEPTDAQILAHAQGARADAAYTPANIVGYWEMRGETPEQDLSGNGYHLTLTGTLRAETAANIPPITELGQ